MLNKEMQEFKSTRDADLEKVRQEATMQVDRKYNPGKVGEKVVL